MLRATSSFDDDDVADPDAVGERDLHPGEDFGERCLRCEVIHEPDHHLGYEADDEPDMEVPDQIGTRPASDGWPLHPAGGLRAGSDADARLGSPDREAHAPAGLDVGEQRVTVRAEGGAGELVVEPRHARARRQPVHRDVPQLATAPACVVRP
jgi:hypothetical protein